MRKESYAYLDKYEWSWVRCRPYRISAMYEPTKNPVGWTGNGFELASMATRSAEKFVHYGKDMYS